jgi:hypothetical protein
MVRLDHGLLRLGLRVDTLMPQARLTTVAQGGVFDEYALTDDDFICDPSTGLPLGGWSNQGTVVNKVDIRFNWNEATQRNDFGARQLFTGTSSVTRYAPQPSLGLEFRGLHLALGGQATLNRFAAIYLQRWGYPPPILQCSVPYRRHLFQALDTLLVTCSKIPNLITGAMGLVNERFEVISVQPRWGTQGRLDLTLLWVSAIETSAVPVPSDALPLVPGTSNIDSTDVDVPFAASADVTAPGPGNTIRIGLKSLNYRLWRTTYDVFSNEQPDKHQPPVCVAQGQAYDEYSYNSRLQYHLDYKTAAAPNTAGIGVDPTSGWVPFVNAGTERGNTSLFGSAGCSGVAGVPGEDVWTEFAFGGAILPGSPTTYMVRAYFDGLIVQGDPYPGALHMDCGNPGCADAYNSSALVLEQRRMTIDFIEAIA